MSTTGKICPHRLGLKVGRVANSSSSVSVDSSCDVQLLLGNRVSVSLWNRKGDWNGLRMAGFGE